MINHHYYLLNYDINIKKIFSVTNLKQFIY